MIKSEKNFFAIRWVSVILAILCEVAWGSAFPLIKKGYSIFSIEGIASPLLFGGIRFVIAGSLLLIGSALRDKRLPRLERGKIGGVLALGTVQTGLVYFFEYVALNYCSGTNSSIVNSIQPFMLTLIACYVFKTEKMSFRKVIGMAIGFAGIIVCYLGESFGTITFLGEGFIIISSTMFAFGTNFAKRLTNSVDTLLATGFNLFIGGAELVTIGLLAGGRMVQGTVQGYAVLTVLALISAVCFIIWTLICKYNPISKIAPFQFVNPISGVVCSAVILGENLMQLKYLFTLFLVSIGIIITNSAEERKRSAV
ncbi:MAG: DMT family transporter [Sphaerochaeta sp.]